MDPLFPALPEDLNSLSDEQLDELEGQHIAAMQLIRENDADFIGTLNAVQVVEQATTGKEQLRVIREHKAALAAAQDTYTDIISDLTADAAEDDGGDEGDGDEESKTELAAEEVEPPVEEPAEPVTASAAEETKPVLRRPPAPSKERQPLPEPEPKVGTQLVAAGYAHEYISPGTAFSPDDFTAIMLKKARALGRPQHHERGVEERYLLASAQFDYPPERRLTSNLEENAEKIRSLQNTDGHSLVASGGLCAPLTPIYTIPQFATQERPVWNSLPGYMADRGGVNTPIPTTLASAADAITVITEAEDALGGTFATKSCLDQTCLTFQETAVTTVSHCREYGNLNARAWPESVTFENELTMAEHARVSETYLLNRIKAQSVVVSTADVYSTTYDLIYAITRAVSAVRYRLRASSDFRFRALVPEWVPDMMITDIAATQFDRFVNRARVTEILRNAGIDPVFYKDNVSTGISQGWDTDQDIAALQDFPDVAQIAVYPEGAFLGIDGGELNLGLVRDSRLNSTNDFQMFGEFFLNVVRLAPAQAALWINATVCPSGEFPALATALSC